MQEDSSMLRALHRQITIISVSALAFAFAAISGCDDESDSTPTGTVTGSGTQTGAGTTTGGGTQTGAGTATGGGTQTGAGTTTGSGTVSGTPSGGEGGMAGGGGMATGGGGMAAGGGGGMAAGGGGAGGGGGGGGAGGGGGDSCGSGAGGTGAKRVFLTTGMEDGDFGGIAMADTICQGIATNNGFGGAWKAWLSDGSTAPASSFTQASVPYVLLDGTQVADDWADLTDGTLDHAINMDHHCQTLTGTQRVWTAVGTSGGSQGSNHCTGWTVTTGQGASGLANSTDNGWTSAAAMGCDTTLHLYCFEQ
jgi:hypothetical protein